MTSIRNTAYAFFLLISFFGQNALSGESGFLHNGREYVTYKDGKQVGKTGDEVIRDDTRNSARGEDRLPASTAAPDDLSSTDLILFQRNNGVTCYHLANHSGLSCVKNDSPR